MYDEWHFADASEISAFGSKCQKVVAHDVLDCKAQLAHVLAAQKTILQHALKSYELHRADASEKSLKCAPSATPTPEQLFEAKRAKILEESAKKRLNEAKWRLDRQLKEFGQIK